MKVEKLHPECRDVHEEIISWLENQGVHITLDDQQVMYQWLERYAKYRQKSPVEDNPDPETGEVTELKNLIPGAYFETSTYGFRFKYLTRGGHGAVLTKRLKDGARIEHSPEITVRVLDEDEVDDEY